MQKKKELVRKNKEVIKNKGAWQLGKNYVIRTVTMIQVGKLKAVYDNELVLENAAWVADAGRWNEFLSYGKASEIEPFPEGLVIVGRGGIIDAAIWKHELLRMVK